MIGFCMTGSFCNFEKAVKVLDELRKKHEILPVMSYNAFATDTRFGTAQYFNDRVTEICGKEIVHTLQGAEPLGPRVKLECMVICPCTGNTLSKLAAGIYDTPVTLAAKAHLRGGSPLVIALATNDALSGNIESIAKMLTRKNVYFVPLSQDDAKNKPYSMICDFSKISETIDKALCGEQVQPIIEG